MIPNWSSGAHTSCKAGNMNTGRSCLGEPTRCICRLRVVAETAPSNGLNPSGFRHAAHDVLPWRYAFSICSHRILLSDYSSNGGWLKEMNRENDTEYPKRCLKQNSPFRRYISDVFCCLLTLYYSFYSQNLQHISSQACLQISRMQQFSPLLT